MNAPNSPAKQREEMSKLGISLPDGIPFAENVPKRGGKGGARCSTCDFVTNDGERCTSKYYAPIIGTDRLLAKARGFCCSVWTPEGGR